MSDIPSEAAAPAEGSGLDNAAQALDALEQRQDLPPESLSELKKLRGEHKTYRERYQPYEQAFQGWNQQDRDAILGWAQMLDRDPVAAARWMHDNAKMLAGDKWAEIAGQMQEKVEQALEQPGQLGQPAANTLTQDQVNQMIEQRLAAERQQMEQQRQVEAIKKQSDDLGFGPTHPLHTSLLSLARENGGDLPAAAEALKQHLAGLSTQQLASKEADASRTPAPANGATPTGQPTGTPEERMRARLDAEFGKAGLGG